MDVVQKGCPETVNFVFEYCHPFLNLPGQVSYDVQRMMTRIYLFFWDTNACHAWTTLCKAGNLTLYLSFCICIT